MAFPNAINLDMYHNTRNHHTCTPTDLNNMAKPSSLWGCPCTHALPLIKVYVNNGRIWGGRLFKVGIQTGLEDRKMKASVITPASVLRARVTRRQLVKEASFSPNTNYLSSYYNSCFSPALRSISRLHLASSPNHQLARSRGSARYRDKLPSISRH